MPMRELIEFLAKSLVDNPDEVKTRTYERDSGTVVELEVAPADLGKVIGRQGRTARAIRTLLTAAGQKTRRRYSLDIVD
ncbi:MAG TPA: KH domain-containing protein [Thermoanaerobaculia bacterium]|nr:KH domain-containing protein [Thermoanaerobaculia bacterium]